jgi:hypothetical protein
MGPEQRYKAVVNASPDSISRSVQGAVDSGILNPSESTASLPVTKKFSVNTIQAVRRLCALLPNVVTSSQARIHIAIPNINTLVKAWRDHVDPDSDFWPSKFDSPEYLELMLHVISAGEARLVEAIKITPLVPPVPPAIEKTLVTRASELPKITTDAWRLLFHLTHLLEVLTINSRHIFDDSSKYSP